MSLRQSRREVQDEQQLAIGVKTVIASQRVGAQRRPMTGSAKQSRMQGNDWIGSPPSLSSGAHSRGPVGSSAMTREQNHG
jgi:hypothetical protein